MSTTFSTTKRGAAAWHVIDAADEVLGRMAARVAQILQGKHKPEWTPHADTGDFVVVVNAERIQLTGRKSEDKLYFRHTGTVGGLVTTAMPRMLERKPADVIRLAVRRMLPKTDLGRHMLSKLKVVAGPSHAHHAQSPKAMALGTSKSARTARKAKASRAPAARRTAGGETTSGKTAAAKARA